MKRRRLLGIIWIILCSGLLLLSCRSINSSSKSVSLDFLITPDEIRMYSNKQLIVLKEIEERARTMIKLRNEKYGDLSKISEQNTKIQEEIHNKSIDVLNSGKTIKNKSTIEDIFNQLRELKGIYVDSFEEFKEDIILRIDLIDEEGMDSSGSLDNPYIPILNLLQDGNIIIVKPVIPKPTNKTTPQMDYIKVKLPEELRNELEELAKD